MGSVPTVFREYIWLVETIYEAGRITLQRLSDKWRDTGMGKGAPLSRTSFNRHRDAVADIFGVFIECDRSTREYYIMNRHSLEEDSVQNWLLTTLSVNNMISESMSVQNRILLEGIPSEGRNLKQVIEAMKKGVLIMIHYQKYGEDVTTERVIEPYCIKLYHRRWYLLGKQKTPPNLPQGEGMVNSINSQENCFRVFAFDRIKDVEVLTRKFKIDKGFSAREYFEDCYGVVNQRDMEVQRVVLRAFGNEANNMRDLPVHSSQRELASGEGYTDFELRLKPSIDFQGHLLSRAMLVKVMEPEWLVKEVKRKLETMLEMYK